MTRAIVRWVCISAAALVTGPLAAKLMTPLTFPWGDAKPTPMLAESVLWGLVALTGIIALTGFAGFATARLADLRSALIACGLTLAWPASVIARSDELVRLSAGRRILIPWMVEGGVLLAVLTLVVAVLSMVARKRYASDSVSQDGARSAFLSAFASPRWPAVILGATIAASIAAWFIGVTPLRWQALAATIGAGIAAGATARIMDDTAPVALMVLPLGLLAVLAPLLGVLITGPTDLLTACDAGRMFRLLHMLPIDWFAGGLIGVPLGMGWAGSMVEPHMQRMQEPATSLAP